jgi:dTDP-4-amino-4,6-dideoxygalactose transaminase
VGCYSFFSNKNMTTGEGGMLVTNEDTIAEQLRLLRSHGMTSLTWDRHKGHAWSYDVVTLGYNYRIDEIRSALGRVQLDKLEKNNAARQHLTNLYRELIQELAPLLLTPYASPRGLSSCHLFPVLLPAGFDRVRFMEAMKADGIQTSIHYPPIHKFKDYSDSLISSAILPVTEEVASRVVTLPLYPTMSEEHVHWVVQAVKEALLVSGPDKGPASRPRSPVLDSPSSV